MNSYLDLYKLSGSFYVGSVGWLVLRNKCGMDIYIVDDMK